MGILKRLAAILWLVAAFFPFGCVILAGAYVLMAVWGITWLVTGENREEQLLQAPTAFALDAYLAPYRVLTGRAA